jgi:hypothetical protein
MEIGNYPHGNLLWSIWQYRIESFIRFNITSRENIGNIEDEESLNESIALGNIQTLKYNFTNII